MQERLILASCCDRGYLPHLATAIRSVQLSGTLVKRWYLFGDESVTAADRDKMRSFAANCGIDTEYCAIPQHLLVDFPARRPSTPIVWLRPLLGELLVEEDRVLSLDADTLVLHDLESLWRFELNPDTYFAAVTQPVYPSSAPMSERLGKPSGAPYF